MIFLNTYQQLSNSICNKAILLILIPFIVFWVMLLFGRVFTKYRGVTATSFMFLNTVLATLLFINVGSDNVYEVKFDWLSFANYKIDFSIYVDSLSALFALIVCFISFLVHLFSIEYLRGDKNFEKYFSFLALFTFAMIGIIFSGNLLQLFVFWELVGFSSYLLIGFWFEVEAATLANKKAFLVNRIGDLGFLIGILILFSFAGTLNIDALSEIRSIGNATDDSIIYYIFGELSNSPISKFWLTIAALGISLGAMSKSAQFPFSVWLPNAMEGPTPVSALIHAATMVAAGIYLLARFSFLMPEIVLDIIAFIGAITAIIAAITAVTQTDIKKVLAYSTISQLGYMVLSIGVQSYDSALFHLLTHAFFKAALFLCAGAIIHSLHKVDHAYGIKKLYPDFDEQDMNQMGGLRTKMPLIFWVYTIALFGIIGVPLFTGFLSKDAILLNSFNWASTKGGFYYLIPLSALLTVGLTSFYMTRQWFMVFFGENRISEAVENAPKGIVTFITKERLNAPLLMKIPPVLLALLTLAPVFSLNPLDGSKSWVYTIFPKVEFLQPLNIDHSYSHGLISSLSIIFLIIGFSISFMMFKRDKLINLKSIYRKTFIHSLSFKFWFLDTIFQKVLINPTMRFAKFSSDVDKHIIDNVPKLAVATSQKIGDASSLVDSKIIDAFIKGIGVFNVIFASISAWFDYTFIDGIVRLISWLGIKIGNIAKIIHKGKVQGYMIWSFVFMILVFVLIYWTY